MAKKSKFQGQLIADNKRARYDYEIGETFEAGLVLIGSEVKSLRLGRVSLNEAHAGFTQGELYLINVHIGEHGNTARNFQHEPKRPRKILLHKRQLSKVMGAVKQGGVTLIPLRLYFNKRGLVKLLLGVAKGRKQVDKRHMIKEREWQRSKAKTLRDYAKEG